MKKIKLSSVLIVAITAAICMTSCGGSGNQPNKKPNDKVVCGDKSYIFRVGEITSNSEKNTTTIQLLTDGQRISFSFSMSSSGTMGQPISPVKMKIEAGNRTIECDNNIGYTNEAIYFTFNTLDMPEKIIVYSNDDKKSTVAYDGKTKEVVFAD